MTDAAIYIRDNQGGFTVTVEPDQPGIAAAEFDDHRSAFGFASGVRMTTRLPIRDETEQTV